jgi:hypothetical protein
MKYVDSCPCCGSKALVGKKRYKFLKPKLNLENDYGKLINDIILERLYILFYCILLNLDEFDCYLTECKDCLFYFTNPRMDEDDIQKKYAEISLHSFGKERYKKYPATNLDSRAQRIHSLLSSIGFNPAGDKSILDMGGAWGYNLLPFKGRANLYVIDFESWELTPGIEYLGQALKDLPEQQRFDCIMYLHTLEHVIDPFDSLQELASRLNEEGIVYVEVPLGVFREMNVLKEPITHINFFCEKSLNNLFERCNLHVLHCSTNYQWVTASRQWCVNIVGGRSPAQSRNIRPMPEWLQRLNPYYYAMLALNKMLVTSQKPLASKMQLSKKP